MKDEARQILSGATWLLMLVVLPAVAIGAASTPTRIIAADLGDSDRQVFERFSQRLEYYRMQLNIPGMSAAVVRNGDLVWAKGFGFADVENEVAATPETPYHLASLTKTFASQIIMKLVEEGKIDLGRPIRDYGVKIRNDPGITVRHLLTHTSEGTPGKNYKYNGSRFGLLGQVVKEASGKSFRELVVSQILAPTQMHDTAPELPRSSISGFSGGSDSVDIEQNFKRINRDLAKPYALNDSLEIVSNEYPNPDHLGVSTGLISTVIDMAKYDKAIENHAFITAESQEMAYTPAVSNSRRTLPYGLGWFVQHFEGIKLIWHYGWEVSYSALILKVPKEDVSFVIFANTDELSRPFNLGAGDVLNSPVAVEFLKSVTLKDSFAEPVPQIDWQVSAEEIVSQIAQAEDSHVRRLLRRELISHLMMHHRMKRTENTRKLMDVYVRCFTGDAFENFKELPVIASIDNVTDNQYKTVEFELDEDKAVRVYAVGEGPSGIMTDYGGIENAETGELIWEMYHIDTEHAGGASKNRKTDRVVPLAAGRYRLHYRSDDSHSFGNWNNLPPDHYWWGTRLFDVSDTVDQSRVCFWGRAAPEELGWSSEKLEALRSDCERLNTAALVIVTDGKLVFEWGKTANNIYSHSTRKSLLSALYGIYVSEGKIDTSMTLEQLGIREKIPISEIEKQARVIDLLKARSGVYIPAAAEVKSMRDARPKRGTHTPGTHWYYNNWDFNVLGTIFRDQTGEDIYEAFNRRIAEPIGMQDYSVEQQNYGYEENFSIHPGYPFLISARDMARVGQLFLQQGQWEGRQIIPADWASDSTRSYSDTGRSWRGYGYMWWTIEDEHRGMQKGDYFASGYGGQNLFVLPRINTVVVHRVNIYLPGIDVGRTSSAPFQLMPRIMQAYTGERKDRGPVITRDIAPAKHLLPDYVAIQAATAAGLRKETDQLLRYTASVWPALVTCCLAGLVLLMARGPCPSWSRMMVWALAILLLGPLGLLAYHFACRQPMCSPDSRAALTKRQDALYASVHSMVGYFVAVAFVVVYLVFLHLDPGAPTIVAVSYIVPFVVGLMVFRAPFVVGQLGGRYWLAVRRTLLLEAVSLNLVLAAVFPTFFFLRFRWFPGDLELANPLFWVLMSVSSMVGVLVIWPFNAWMSHRGFGSALVRGTTGRDAAGKTETRLPLLRNIWQVLLLSLVLLVASVCATVSGILY